MTFAMVVATADTWWHMPLALGDAAWADILQWGEPGLLRAGAQWLQEE